MPFFSLKWLTGIVTDMNACKYRPKPMAVDGQIGEEIGTMKAKCYVIAKR